jgi:hypothetical protein
MVKINYEYLEIDHIVDFVHDATVFAAARENGNGHMRIFLINEATGNVYTRNGKADSWERLYGSERDTVIARLVAARNRNVPVYRINGSGSSN